MISYDFYICTFVDLIKTSPVVNIHKLMNVVPLIQEKWAEIGTRLNFSLDELNTFWQTADYYQIPAESRNTFCCIQMLKQWFEANGNSSVDTLIKAIDVPYIGLQSKISSIKSILATEHLTTSTEELTTTMPPEKLQQLYMDMKAKFCLELSKSQHAINDVLVYLKLCNIKSEIFTKVTDYPRLIKLLEKHDLLSQADLSWLKYIATCSDCMKATEVIGSYEKALIADKIVWSSKHPEGTFLVGKVSKSPEFVTIKDSSDAKSAASKIVELKETDSITDSSEVGSVVFYWRVLKEVTINIPEFIDAFVAKECSDACLTHIGIMIDGKLDLESIDKLTGTYMFLCIIYVRTYLQLKF